MWALGIHKGAFKFPIFRPQHKLVGITDVKLKIGDNLWTACS
jgi:hypothetical protein